MNIEYVMEPLRNLLETLSTENLIISRNYQCWPKFLVSYKKYTCTCFVFKCSMFENLLRTTSVTHQL